MKRRTFIASTLAALDAIVLPSCSRTRREGTLLSAFEDAVGDQYVGGLSLATASVFGAKVPVRVS